jgi:RimJ/RimL family protein N-acetyltransferase
MTSAPKTPTLQGTLVRLEPLSLAHLPALEAIAFDPSIWQYMTTWIATPTDLRAWVEEALRQQAAGSAMPWVIVAQGLTGAADAVIGSTRFADLSRAHRHTELGYTWLAEPYRGTGLNTEVKLLQLRFGFETLGLNRIAFKTHHANERSQAALRKLGAVYEGTFRHHYFMPDGSLRDSVWYSIVREEWPAMKLRLTARVAEFVALQRQA